MSEYQHVEKPFLGQFGTLGWKMVDQGHGIIPVDPGSSLTSGDTGPGGGAMERETSMRKRITPGEEIAASLREAIAWARGEDAPVRVTRVEVPVIDVREVRRKLRLSQTQFAARFGFAAASVRS
jgi:DNA-binding transcriptional regulator YiaG